MIAAAIVAAAVCLANGGTTGIVKKDGTTGSLRAMRAEELRRITAYETIAFDLGEFDSEQRIGFTFGEQSYTVQLFAKEHLTPNRIKHTNGHLDASSRWFTALNTPCHFSGRIIEPAHLTNVSAVALSLCPNRGVRGSILLDD